METKCFDFLCRSFQSNHPRGPKGPIDSQRLKMEQVKRVLQQPASYNTTPGKSKAALCNNAWLFIGFGDLDLKKGVDHDLKLEKGEVWNKI